MSAYEKLMARARELFLLRSAGAVVHWDMETYMPPRGIAQRSEQLALLSKLEHRLLTSPEVGRLLDEAEKEDLDEVQQRNCYLFRKEYAEATAVPEELVAALAKQTAITVDVWKRAKASDDWATFVPELSSLVDLVHQKAEYVQDVKGASTIYDTLIDDFEPNMTQDRIAHVFSDLRDRLVPLVDKCVDACTGIDIGYLHQKISVDMQKRIALDLATVINYDVTSDKAGGRIDETEHPFTTGYYDDVRVTVHYYEDNVASAIFAVLHEGGHALYEQNLNPEWKYQPVGQPCSFGIHESQSRFIENMVGRTREFWDFYLPRLSDLTNGAFSALTTDNFLRGVNIVRRSKVRTEADEVTYSLHVIIRFEIERDLWSGKISVSELPSVWNEKYDRYLGVEVKTDSEGVMQDTHWASGLFGYFPSYALGNIYGGQMLAKMGHDIPDWREAVKEGNTRPVVDWLIENVHRKSNLYEPAELVRRITGSDLTAKPFLDYLEHKYSTLFAL